ncbi:rCG22506 [Rattus norvegicus]|uniref:RCG22506 n=1 Tax=Rattus norvegicus TaxID=10116 RepID=A6INF4_RAT|nr:rCG22506 [Rattus norvegicus]
MSDVVFFSFVVFLGSRWGAEPLSIPVTEGVENEFSSSSKHLEEDMAKLFDEIVLQVFPSTLDGTSTAGRLITGRDVNESKYMLRGSKRTRSNGLCGTYLHHNGVSDSVLASSSYQQDDYLDKIFAHAAEKNKDKEPSLFNRDLSHQLTAGGKEALQENAQVAYRESPPCSQLLSFLQKNIISATTAMASILLVAVLVVLMLVMCVRRRQPKFSPAKMTYNIFIMNGKAWWQNSQDKHLKKFTGKQKYPKFNSFV